MHVSCIQAGTLLARLGRPEVSNCINAMEQYTPSYEEAGEQGLEMRRIYSLATSGEFDFAHMASVAPKVEVSATAPENHQMTLDPPMHIHMNGDVSVVFFGGSLILNTHRLSHLPFWILIQCMGDNRRFKFCSYV